MATRKWLLAMLTGLGVAASAGMALPVQAADSTLTISDAQFLWTCGFSPYNPSANFLSVGVVYETLMFVNTLQNAKNATHTTIARADASPMFQNSKVIL